MKISQRRKARYLALQAIYQWQLTAASSKEILTQFLSQPVGKADTEYFQELLEGTIQNSNAIDVQITPILDRALAELNPVELSVLRLATYELLFRMDIPYKVVINEALELTKTFGALEGFKYVNGVLDKIAHRVRAVEITEKKSQVKSDKKV